MATNQLSKLEIESRLFDGIARFIIFPDYDLDTMTATSKVEDILATGGVDLGRIVEGSPSWEGDDVSTEVLKDTEGGAIRTRVTAGTCAYGLRIPHTEETANRIGARQHTLTATTDGSYKLSSTKKAIGVNPKDLAGKHYPCAVLNLTHNELAVFPKGNVSYAPTLEDNDLLEYNVKASADDIKTKNLDTMMFVPIENDPFAVEEDEEENP